MAIVQDISLLHFFLEKNRAIYRSMLYLNYSENYTRRVHLHNKNMTILLSQALTLHIQFWEKKWGGKLLWHDKDKPKYLNQSYEKIVRREM